MERLDCMPDATPYSGPVSSRYDSEECNCPSNYIQSHQRQNENLYYDMSGDKILIIFNHYKYRKTRHYKIVPTTREGTYQDVMSLEQTFRRLGFVVVTHDDWTRTQIMNYLSSVCKKDHSKTSCFAVAVMSHGKGSHVCAADRMYPVNELLHTVRAAPSLARKPKLFFLQACRAGHTNPPRYKTTLEDFDSLVIYSSYEDYLSYRSSECGTWLMQALCKVLDKHHQNLDLAHMVTLVNSLVAAKSCCGDKQMPVTESNLTKFLML